MSDKIKDKDIEFYCNQLEQGNVLAYPTETLWGLGVDISNEEAVEKVFKLKERDRGKPISILVADTRMAEQFAILDEQDKKLLNVFWPGPLTLVVPITENVPEVVHAGTNMVGLRCSSHPFVKRLLRSYNKPISTTSANRAGQAPAHRKEDLVWGPKDIVIVDDPTNVVKNPGSTIVRKAEDGYELLREGQLDIDHIKKVVKLTILNSY